MENQCFSLRTNVFTKLGAFTHCVLDAKNLSWLNLWSFHATVSVSQIVVGLVRYIWHCGKSCVNWSWSLKETFSLLCLYGSAASAGFPTAGITDKPLLFDGDWSFLRSSCCKYLNYVLSRQSVGCWGVCDNEGFCIISICVLQDRILWECACTSSCISHSIGRLDFKISPVSSFSLHV